MLNSRSLDDLRADVRANVETLLSLCKAQGMQILVTQTKRDNEYQAYLYAQGRTRPGSIITNSKTTTFHGAGLAIDFCENVKGREYADAAFFQNVSIIAKAMGFSWGGDWKSFPDFPHLQWDDRGRYTTAMLRAGRKCPEMPLYRGPIHREEDDNMTGKEIYDRLTAYLGGQKEAPSWAKAEIEEAKALGITDGTAPMAFIPRYQAAIMAKRAVMTALKEAAKQRQE